MTPLLVLEMTIKGQVLCLDEEVKSDLALSRIPHQRQPDNDIDSEKVVSLQI